MTHHVVETIFDLGGAPPSPGAFIQEDIIEQYGLTQQQLADRLGVSRRAINELISSKRSISTDMALRLSELTGQKAEYWLNLQVLFEVWQLRARSESFGIVPLSDHS